ncbi:TonB-linked SusC/RagA family outer membrane protein [Dysgonomonas sp. PFB1-18]|uniref:SusC/RagA family TonB-linked outer membrane protein n=1 Tax=unclassified Dysgonomonas TaxID=2630389 RepID=UPI0024764F91|nr:MULTISPECIES: TonB-dependent receptor [unclassified Dysgonomonas]MDH6307364.1 TonB-linked SusC/RagA family outer membrane protein [Dysgonomonas sp. PF1-14]MDH6337282.1 TonB-linked SusC/RagA family outer membrane protein [Dysgonomonas sp. PF1-16]MDH6379206.1 TonB-linked SusC/RagA family outer membrane protein [Dysgonomonas sp. PFB1-18]MDH6396156.1 TonB-linked SusC/RagA family outer membrane protein [Dysgonomonas sp. PF1-23]
MKRKLLLILSFLLLSLGYITAQTTKITGIVVDDLGEPAVGASVVVKGTTTGTVTDANGLFSISLPQGRSTLVFTLMGMKTKEETAKPDMKVIMEQDAKMMDEIVVVGYGTQKKKDVTSAISRVSGDDISNLATPSFESQLAGRAAGVQVATPSAMLGQAPKFNIRGFSTISSGTQPLVIVDGVPVTSGEVQQLYGRYNPLAEINPNDIESYEVLKDGAATAIYGSRAANGVILITTKSGGKSKTKVTYDVQTSWAKATKLHKLLNAKEFVEIANEKYENWGETGPAVLGNVDTDWNDYVYRTGFQQTHNLSASGGTDKSQYFVSLGYTDQNGIIRNNEQERYSATAKLTQTANKWLKIGVNISASKSKLEGVMNEENSLGSVGFAATRMLPNVPVYNPDDVTGYNIDAANRKALGRGVNETYIDNGIQNIVWAMDNNVNRSQSLHVTGGGFAEVTFMEGLTFRTQAGIDYTSLSDFMKWDAESGDGYGSGGVLEDLRTTFYNWNWQNILTFNRTFDKLHNLNLTAVQEYTHSDYEWVDASVSQLSENFFTDHIISETFGIPNIGGDKTYNGLASYMFRANYNYDSKYYLGGSVRRDGLSKLPKDTRWGTFFGGSLAWRMSRENFWTSSSMNNIFDDLRLRASFATIGNSNLSSNFPYMGIYSAKYYGGQSGVAWTNMGNDNLKWESTTTYDIGLDGSLLNNRLSFEIAYFNKKTKDLVLEVPTAPALGIPNNSYYDNRGKLKNSGLEFTLGGTPVVGAFTWQADLNFTILSNKVLELVDHAPIIGDYTIIQEGKSYASIYGYQFYGVNKSNGNPIWVKGDGSLVQFDTFGNYDYAVYDPANPSDVSQPSSLSTTEDRKILGSSLPKWYGGFNNTFTYKNFDLNVFFRFSGGNKIMNASAQESLLNTDFANNGKIILGRWQSAENPGDGIIPKLGYGDGSVLFNQGSADSRFVENGSYLKLSNLSLGYTLPQSLVSKLDMTKIRFYVQAQNLFTITGYSGLDPETSTRQGADWDGMPQQRVLSFGANITF